jgi:hypothetical protein
MKVTLSLSWSHCPCNPKELSTFWKTRRKNPLFWQTYEVLVIRCGYCKKQQEIPYFLLDVAVELDEQAKRLAPILHHSGQETQIAMAPMALPVVEGIVVLDRPENSQTVKASGEFTPFDREFLRSIKIRADEPDNQLPTPSADK